MKQVSFNGVIWQELTGSVIPGCVFPSPSPSFHPILESILWPLFSVDIALELETNVMNFVLVFPAEMLINEHCFPCPEISASLPTLYAEGRGNAEISTPFLDPEISPPPPALHTKLEVGSNAESSGSGNFQLPTLYTGGGKGGNADICLVPGH